MLERFRSDLDRLNPTGAKLGVAVSGGPDSLALLLLASAALPGRVEAATVDHGLRDGSADEAQFVASLCSTLAVEHRALRADWVEPPQTNIQSAARERRYALLAQWAYERGIDRVATAHHADDQAETVLMRLFRGSGVAGLAGIRPVRDLDSNVRLIRPLLGWRRSELAAIVDAAGLRAIADPSNANERFDRTSVRRLLASAEWIDPVRLAATASHARDADEALDWIASNEFRSRSEGANDCLMLDLAGLPRELKRRVLLAAITSRGVAEPSGPDLINAIERLERAQTTTLAGLKLEPGPKWRLSIAKPRRSQAATAVRP
ncbi:MAG: tRNA lysidine(34) synthetase TilS [Sphingomicrobium sp.]